MQFQCVPSTYVTENKKTILKFTFRSIMSIVFTSLNISDCRSVFKFMSLYHKLFNIVV